MSTNSELRALFARLGPVRDADPPPSFPGELVTLVLRLVGPLDKPVTVAKRLRAAGLTLRAAHTAINRLAEKRITVCEIAEGADIPALASDLAGMNVFTYRRRHVDPGLLAEVRNRHGLSQREFANVLGIEVDTLQNWEQGRNKPDPAALALAWAYDRGPEVVAQAILEPVV